MRNHADLSITGKKSKGFSGQRMIVLPEKVIRLIKSRPLSSALYLTHIGYFPKAANHFRKRTEGTDQHILIYCTEGSGWLDLSGNKKTIGPDEVMIIPAGTPHQYGADSATPWTIYWTHFAGSQSHHFIETFQQRYPDLHIHTPSHSDRISLFNELFEALEMGFSIENAEFTNAALWHFLATFCHADTYRSLKTVIKADPVERTILYMRENLREQLTLSKLSEIARLSKSYYSGLFKKKTGYSPIEYLIHLRIQNACQFLDMTDMQVKEIAQESGFSDHHYFTRIFTKTMGCPPTTYRKNPKG